MKKLLSILGTISLITSGSNNLIACDNNNFLKKLSTEEIEKLKKENSKIIKGNKLELILQQEKPFKTVDNKWYIVIKTAPQKVSKIKKELY